MFRPIFLSFTVLVLAAACGDKAFSPGPSAETPSAETPGAETPGAAAGSAGAEEVAENKNISQELLDKLKATKDEAEAAMLEEEIWDAWDEEEAGE